MDNRHRATASAVLKVGVVYKVTYPNGKIYVGQDRTDDANYFGSADAFTVAADFTQDQLDDFAIRKQVLHRVYDVTIRELNALEKREILNHNSNDPRVGYNRTPRHPRRICRTRYKEDA